MVKQQSPKLNISETKESVQCFKYSVNMDVATGTEDHQDSLCLQNLIGWEQVNICAKFRHS